MTKTKKVSSLFKKKKKKTKKGKMMMDCLPLKSLLSWKLTIIIIWFVALIISNDNDNYKVNCYEISVLVLNHQIFWSLPNEMGQPKLLLTKHMYVYQKVGYVWKGNMQPNGPFSKEEIDKFVPRKDPFLQLLTHNTQNDFKKI